MPQPPSPRWPAQPSTEPTNTPRLPSPVVNTGLSEILRPRRQPGANLSLAQYFQQRLNRDVINVAGVTDVILYDGSNDYGSYGLLAPATIAAYQTIVSRV